MSLQKREVAKDDRAQEGSITLDRKTRKRSRVIALYGKATAAAAYNEIRRTPLPTQKRVGAFFHGLFTDNSSNALVFPSASAIISLKEGGRLCAWRGRRKTQSRAARRVVTVCAKELREVKRMFDMYLVTGATGFLGRTIVEELVRRGSRVRALVLHGDPCTKLLPP